MCYDRRIFFFLRCLKIIKKNRRVLLENVTAFTNIKFNQFSTASLITRSTNDIQVIQNTSFMIFRVACYLPIMEIDAYTTIPRLSYTIAIAILGILVVMLFMLIVTMPKLK